MKISKEKTAQIDNFLTAFIEFVKSKTRSRYYKSPTKYGPSSGYIELSNGLLIPEKQEAPFVLDNEFEQFILQHLAHFMLLMHQQIESKLFGFAERPLFEYITCWVFVFKHPAVTERDKERLKTLLFAGHYKYIVEDNNSFVRYLKRKAKYLTARDLKVLNSDLSSEQYFKRLWDISKETRDKYGEESYLSFLRLHPGYNSILSHQHLRVHSNPLSINEVLGDNEKATRHRLLLCYYARQVLDYFLDSEDKRVGKLKKQYDDLFKDLHVEL